MKVKKSNKWLTRVLVIVFLALVGIGGLCRNPYTSNPNLKLLVGDTTTKYDSIHCSNPVVSMDEVVYYLGMDRDSVGDYDFAIGAVYSINSDGSNNQKILNGNFNALAISKNAQKLAVHPYSGSYPNYAPDSLILILRIFDSEIDSYPISKKEVRDIEFAENGQWVYYSVDASTASFNRTEFFRLHLSDSSNELLQTVDWYLGFDLFKDNSLYFDSIMARPQINPIQEEYVIGTYGYERYEFLLRNTVMHELDTLPDSLMPYYDGCVGYSYWFPNGKDIGFMAKPYSEPAGVSSGEIWILENVFEQIEE